MRTAARNERGWAVVTAIVVMSIMLTIGLAAIAFVDTETRSSHRERIAEARLNLTEGALAAEIFQLSRRWPYTLSLAYPASCTEASTELLCPNPAQLRAQFDAVDFALAPGWDVRVRDNVTGDSQYYEDASVLQRPRWDANADGEMWIRAQGNLDGKPRIVVARVRVEKRPVIHPPPGGPFVAGSFRSGNNGGNVLVATAPNANGVVRCSNVNSSSCVDYKPNQLSPVNSVKSDPSAGPNLAPETVESLRQIAQAAGTYYASGCPLDPSGDVVFVESGNCSYTNSSPNPVNGTSKRGIFVVASGTLSISGNITWWGAVYALNLQNCGSVNSASCINASNGDKDVVVQISGTVALRGGVYIDGAGRLAVGSSGNAGNGGIPNLTYDPSVVSDVTAFGNAGIIQNTWRELMTG